jgi:RimJ/RimL family protein N-acetyltransferase
MIMHLPDVIHAERVSIRPFREEDLTAYLEFMTDPRATRYLMLEPEQQTPAGARALFNLVRQSYQTAEPIWALAIATDADGFVGSCGISSLEDTIVECYYSLLPKYWGRGYATEALRALLDYVFTHTVVTEVRAYMSPANPNSFGVAERVGMERRGLHRHPLFENEGLLYVLTKEAWQDPGEDAHQP